MNNKYSKMIALYILCLCIVGLIGLSASFFTSLTPSESASTIYAKGASLNIRYDNKSANISVSNIYPREEAWVTKNFEIINENPTDLLVFYRVKMIVDNNEFGTDLSYSISGTNVDNNGWTIVDGKSNFGKHDVVLGTGHFAGGKNKVHSYTLKIFLKSSSDDQNYAQEANFAAHLVIEVDGTSTEAAPKNWSVAEEDTLLGVIRETFGSPNKTLTNPVSSSATSNITEISAAPDDYGISYYLRGDVENNFVIFAGMCWRIVRVTGDGSIKLVLYDDVHEEACTYKGDDFAYARYDANSYVVSFNGSHNDAAYVGLMYGTPNSNTYAATHMNTKKSDILQSLETWYVSKGLTDYSDELADVIWCNDKSTVNSATYYSYSNRGNGNLKVDSISYNGLGYKNNMSIFGSGLRLSSLDVGKKYSLGTGPSLICPNDNNGGKLSKFTVDDTVNGNGSLKYKIGLLTADEVVLSGIPTYGVYSNSNEGKNINSYLNENADYGFLTSSPDKFTGDNVYFLSVSGDSKSLVSSADTNRLPLRPVIALKADTMFGEGIGTAASPFIVN